MIPPYGEKWHYNWYKLASKICAQNRIYENSYYISRNSKIWIRYYGPTKKSVLRMNVINPLKIDCSFFSRFMKKGRINSSPVLHLNLIQSKTITALASEIRTQELWREKKRLRGTVKLINQFNLRSNRIKLLCASRVGSWFRWAHCLVTLGELWLTVFVGIH